MIRNPKIAAEAHSTKVDLVRFSLCQYIVRVKTKYKNHPDVWRIQNRRFFFFWLINVVAFLFSASVDQYIRFPRGCNGVFNFYSFGALTRLYIPDV